MQDIIIRPAVAGDAQLILGFIRELARYEKAEHEVVATVADIEGTILDPGSPVEAVVCEQGGEPIGFAVYFYTFSTWLGRKGLYLEDLYVTPAYRGAGAGKALLRHLARKAVAEGCGRFEWSVLDWNEPAIRFYESIGARPKSEWIMYQLAGAALIAFSDS